MGVRGWRRIGWERERLEIDPEGDQGSALDRRASGEVEKNTDQIKLRLWEVKIQNEMM